MEEEQGEDSEVLDAMDGWDSEEENQSSGTAGANNAGSSPGANDAQPQPTTDLKANKTWDVNKSFCPMVREQHNN